MSVLRSNNRCHAFVIGWPLKGVGGVSEVVRNLVREFESEGRTTPLLIEACDGEPDSNDLKTTVLRIASTSPFEEKRRWRAMAAFCLKLPASLWRWRCVLRRFQIGTLNPHFIGPDHLVLALARRLGFFRGTLIFSFHGTDVHAMVGSRGGRRLVYRFLLRSADWLVPCSEGLASYLREFDPLSAKRIRPIRNGIDAAHFLGSEEEADLPTAYREGRLIVSVGAYQRPKGHDILLRAFAEVRAQQPDLRLVIAGGPGSEWEPTQALAEELGVKDFVLFLRSIPSARVAALLQAADLFVLASRREGFAIVLLEAAAAGKPVVATEACGVTELIRDGETGWTVPMERPDLLAQAIRDALGNPEEMARRSGQLRKQVLEEFTWRKACEDYASLDRRRKSEAQTSTVTVPAVLPMAEDRV